MNRNIVYIIIAVFGGLFVGWLLFGTTTDSTSGKGVDHDHSGEATTAMWTCSMHPQIMQPEPGDCPICGMDLIPAESSSDGLALNEIKMTPNAMALANVRTTIVGEGSADVGNTLTLSGKIKMNEEENSIQASYFDGRFEQLYIDYEGQEIRTGQLLATIYSPQLVATQQELITAFSLKESQPYLYNAVRNKLKLWKLSEAQISAIETSGKVRENFPIYATVSGTVSEKMAAEGDYVKQGQPLLKVSNLNSVWAEFDAYENQISQFKKGQKINIVSNAYPNETFEAEVSFIDPVLSTQSHTVTVRATLNNKAGKLKPGMFVKGQIENAGNETSSELTIPASAVMWTGERSLVYVKTRPNEPIFQMREITLGTRSGDRYEVVDGLQSGEEIVTNGTFTVDAAAQLQGKQSMMNQNAAKDSVDDAPMMKMSFPESFQKEFLVVLQEYLVMKDAFVESNQELISSAATATKDQLESLPISDVNTMEKSHISTIIQRLEAISKSESLERQREHFVVLNENMVPVVMNIGTLTNNIFVQKCPMANNNKGAFWLSSEKEIRNPYYGDQMMTCGSVIETIKNRF
ncbi:efflux RND transporter periplasmic adaptor subunit [Maribacter sp. X9]|uniref:efflux RND transporter periplasmic adaptor subunit n=1 Tax=Maribacter sp. X9 TaxID=3402159 RepID=UPI003AF340FE